jgi:cytidylate kinase
MIITLDGPSGTGKSTIAKLIAQKLGFTYFDTGAMYRAFAWYLLVNHVNIHDASEIGAILPSFSFDITESTSCKRYLVNGTDVTDLIRTPEITEVVSPVSAHKVVRDLLSKTQRECGSRGNAVFEGRDLGSVIFPSADLKIYLTARPEVRAKRRYLEFLAKNPTSGFSESEILASINKRDEYDSSREIAPLKCPSDAIVVDTSDLSIDQVVTQIIIHAKSKLKL